MDRCGVGLARMEVTINIIYFDHDVCGLNKLPILELNLQPKNSLAQLSHQNKLGTVRIWHGVERQEVE